jgi:hypothetical protein
MTTLIPVSEYEWSNDYSYLRTLTCKNHPTAKYLTKNPWQRGLHFIKPPVEAPQEGWPLGGYECPCSFGDLVVVVEATDQERELKESMRS